MPLAAGTRLGPYEIAAPLGAGGMGEVYRARDTRLERTVALKVLPSHLAASPELRQRFEREARAISALNHRHICVLHDVGRQDGIDYLVMEYIDGETLAHRLDKGPIPLAQVLRYGVEIAEALDSAHRQGVVHRDLKPGNVMLTKAGVKLLDFGLAKLTAGAGHPPEAAEVSASATETENEPLTAEGRIMGTFQYMAPEQLEGKEPDGRTDIFALGAVLYEMATGQRAFMGNSRASLRAAILAANPAPVSRLQPLTPPALDRVVAKCLAKDPDERWQSAHDIASELKWIAEGGSEVGIAAPSGARSRVRGRLAWTAAAGVAALLGMALGIVVGRHRESPEKPLQVRFEIRPPENSAALGAWGMALSPDGDRIAFPASFAGTNRLYVRPLNSAIATRVPGTDGGHGPFWSPDGRQLGFVANRQLMKIDLSGGPPQTLCDLDGALRGATWGPDGTIAFSSSGVLSSARATTSNGNLQPLGKPTEGETGRFWPQFLPDGRRYLYSSRAPRSEDSAVYVASLDSDDRTRIVASDGGHASYSRGHLLFMRGGVLWAQRFDATTLEVSGEAFPVSDEVALLPGVFPGAAYAASANGVLAWRSGSGLAAMQLTWFDRSGRKLGTVGEPADYSNPALSPDERSLAVGRLDPQRKSRDLWIFDLMRGTSTRLTFDPAEEFNPTWSPDGTRVAFTSDRRGVREIYQKPANGSGDDALLVESTDWPKHVEDWSPDGKYLLYNYSRGGLPSDLFLWPLLPGADRNPIPFVTTAFVEREGRFAPQGGWVAYCSNESGRIEVYVRRASPDGASGQEKWRVSTAGGITPQWRRDGKELFYVSGSTLMAVDVKADGASFEAGMPRPLFEVRLSTEPRRNHFVVSRDGQRFLVNTVIDQAGQVNEPIQVLLNWLPSNR